MPTYEYRCPGCGWTGDGFCAIDDRHRQVCSSCGHLLHLQVPSRPPAGRVDSIARARRIRDAGLIELGNEHPTTIAREAEKQERYAEERNSAEIKKAMLDEISRVGWDSFRTSDPTEIRRQNEDHHDPGLGSEDAA